jgi:hypothetical protein
MHQEDEGEGIRCAYNAKCILSCSTLRGTEQAWSCDMPQRETSCVRLRTFR